MKYVLNESVAIFKLLDLRNTCYLLLEMMLYESLLVTKIQIVCLLDVIFIFSLVN